MVLGHNYAFPVWESNQGEFNWIKQLSSSSVVNSTYKFMAPIQTGKRLNLSWHQLRLAGTMMISVPVCYSIAANIN